ncbi:hypothetical protein GCM10010193_29010 [Kitasatospora atroaurantiaca]|uniref:STAS/SEC14 domain-containing protein n=1 Tax=Kitasatospora atroaurantiaca TaxID=285545 RepID=A0A561EIU7_9ACTN|nr:hypothetical protein [Kitasatospora atroaurantiaca]TWE15547.1 hypothetical protein FB465_0447 [Kitasatospora atroaurantiaca]
MTTELDRDDFGRITHDPAAGRLELEWFESTEGMADQDFRRSLERLAALSEEHRPRHVVIDVTRFAFSPDADTARWRQREIIPRYNASGIEKFAFLLPASAPSPGEPAPEPGADFPTGWFPTREALEEWLRQP